MLAGGAEPVSGWRIGVPAIGALAGGGVRISCLSGVETGAAVLLPLAAGFFVALVLAWALGAIFCLRVSRGWLGEKFSPPVVGL